MFSPLNALSQVFTAVVFRDQPPQEDPKGNVRALAIRDLVSSKPLQWHDLPRVAVQDKYLAHCLQPGDVVIPSRGDYYKAWLFPQAEEPVLPVGQLNVIRPSPSIDAGYLVWYLNLKATQAKISLMLTGSSIKALTKTSLVSLEIETPDLPRQRRIAELDQTTRRIRAIRHRLSELDDAEIAYVTSQLLRAGGAHA
ncbi:restriction endonuclease subunit S [Scleromatobacter humisilvae]|uniref:Restriction endonuclease subunit S n=1 Tax=Scleromatobacter humisilvae TaxID=2897159 RepID=A0A9X1YNG0_9BURK|nr:restriction endonuclease subunit S [Scleromatobacter humisilvae]MCK9689489.1 restriction endonuclease subunit S [Scleromatobacter humisilvae]